MSVFDLVIFGGLGDLSRRKLLPALYSGFIAGRIDSSARIYLTSRSELQEDTLAWLTSIFDDTPPACGIANDKLTEFASMVDIVQLELNKDGGGWAKLADSLGSENGRPLVHFLAIPPAFFTSTCELLGAKNLNHAEACVVLEKPLGHNQATAAEINDDVARFFSEDQTFRIDHYLGKEAVQNLLALRFSNLLFEQLWNKQTIDHIQITIAENQGVEGRGGFYEGTGALKDMVQNHLLQLLCFIAMEPPARLNANGIREEKLKVLKSLKVLEGSEIDENVVRAQYTAGAMDGAAVKSYVDDIELDGKSETDTFVAIKANIDNWRWAGVPFYLRTGKRLPERYAEIVIQFKDVPHASDPKWHRNMEPNRFIIKLQPVDHLAMRMMIKDDQEDRAGLREVELNLDVGQTGNDAKRLGPYLRLILDAARGDQSLFVHRNEVDLAWAWIDKIVDHWKNNPGSLMQYQAGTWGPYEAHGLMKRDGREWYLDGDHK
jgi:glucose-6-phosphate 1-dehydrogenase